MCGSRNIRGTAIPAGDDTEHVSACSTTDAMAAPAYTMTARVLHWLTAFLILAMIPLGVVIANEWGGARQDSLYDLHRSLGALLIFIVVARLIWRWMHPPLPLPDDIAAIQRFASHVTHWGLYALRLVLHGRGRARLLQEQRGRAHHRAHGADRTRAPCRNSRSRCSRPSLRRRSSTSSSISS
jgi:hypothetical protein